MSDEISKTKAPVAVLEYEPSAFELALIKHKSKLILVGVLTVVGTAGYWGYRLYTEATHKSAAVAFSRAQSVEDLKKVANERSGQTAGGNAAILAADLVSADRPAEAVEMLRGFVSKNPAHPLLDLASFRIAEYSAAARDAAGAEKEYEAVAKANSPYSAFALLRLGDMKWGAGDATKAKEYYDRILTTQSMAGSPARSAAQRRVDKDIKAKAPELVEYKEEPPAPPPATPGAPNGPEATGTDLNGDPGSLLPPPALPKFPTQPEPMPETPPAEAPKPVTPAAIEATPPAAPADKPAETAPAADAKPADAAPAAPKPAGEN